jgi:F-type H+-transporting ATPase subunit b
MPQFDVASFGPQLFWLVFVFGTLYLLVSKFIAPKAESILTARNRFLTENLSSAEDYNQKAAMLRDEIEAKLQEVNHVTEEMHIKTTMELDSHYERHKHELSLELQSKTEKALLEIDEMISTFHNREIGPCLNLASFIIEKITNKPVDSALLDKIHKKA